MKVNNKKNILKTIAGLAMSGALALGALGIYGITKDPMQDSIDNYTRSTARFHQGVIEGQEAGKTYYVAPNGSGTDYSSEKPGNILDLLKDGSPLQPGDTVLVAGGVYALSDRSENVTEDRRIRISFSGTHDKYITIKAADPSNQPVLDFTGQSFSGSNRGVQIDGNYFYWYDIDIMGAGDNGMYIGGSYNVVEGCEFYNNRDTGLQLGRSYSDDNGAAPQWADIDNWPSYNIIKNCTSHNNYDNETKGENADGFACKLTVGYGNVFDGCIAYRNSDDGWDLYAKNDSGNIGTVLIYNCVAYENGFVEYKRSQYNALFPLFDEMQKENIVDGYTTNNGDGNGFKLGGENMEADIFLYNCLSFNNRLHGFTDNSNPGFISVKNCTSYNNYAAFATSQQTENDDGSKNVFNEGNSGLDGQVIKGGYHGDASDSANIDLHRHDFSYNSIEKVFAMQDFGTGNSADNILGSATDSILNNGKNVITGAQDVDITSGGTGTELSPSSVFEELPIVRNGNGDYTYNISGLEDSGMDMPKVTVNDDYSVTITAPGTGIVSSADRAHLRLRNSDGSVNMGDILKIKAGQAKVGNVQTGAFLSETSDTYNHDYFTENLSTAKSADEAVLMAAKDALYLPTDQAAVFQNFELATKIIGGTQVNWTSDKEDVIKIGKVYSHSNSTSEYVTAEVFRPTEDTEVKLTASLNYRGNKTTRDFTVTVKGGKPTLGDLYVEGAIGGEIVKLEEGNTTIVDLYLSANEPKLIVTNGLDYAKKPLDKSLYDVETTYEYGANGLADFNKGIQEKVPFFTPANDGVFKITHKVTLKDNSQSKTVSYYINVASNQANVKFLEIEDGEDTKPDYDIGINLKGYTVTGTPTGAIGTIHSLALPATDPEPTAEKVVSDGVAVSFRATSLDVTFEKENTEAYNIYLAFTNGDGKITSEVYKKEVGVVEIDTPEKFKTLATTSKVGDEKPSLTIYSVTQDLDMSSVAWENSSTAFTGLINGNKHTISNITVSKSSGSNTGVFYRLKNGTIMNIAFEDVTINGNGNKTGLIAETYDGYVSNVKLTNVNVNGGTGNSCGVLIGQISTEGGEPLYGKFFVDRVSVIGCSAKASGGRIGGIAGAIQVSGSSTEWIDLNVTNCFVDKTTVLGGHSETGGVIATEAEYVGGILGRCQNQNDNNKYYIANCYSEATIYAKKNGAAQIVAAFNATQGDITVENCVAAGKIYWAALQDPLIEPEKNASGIVGKFFSNIKVDNCYSLLNEYFGTQADNGEYKVTKTTLNALNGKTVWENLKFDSSIWTFTAGEGANYSMTLNF